MCAFIVFLTGRKTKKRQTSAPGTALEKSDVYRYLRDHARVGAKSKFLFFAQHVAHAAHGVDQACFVVRFCLLA
jgi:hypothetical protein